VDGELDPINLGGHVVMSRNATHKNLGPKLFFNYKTASLFLPYFKVCVNYILLLVVAWKRVQLQFNSLVGA